MLAIFDMSAVNVERYNSEFLKKHIDEYTAYVDDPDCCAELTDLNATLFCTAGWSIQRLINSFKERNISTLMISGQRPADFRVIIAANTLHIPVVYKMHGLYVEGVKRNMSFYLLSIKKVFRTVRYLINIGRFTNSIKIPFGILLSFVAGVSRKFWMTSDLLQVDHGLIWSQYWQAWHEKNWFMSPKRGWDITGNPDTLKFTKVQLNTNNVCYIYQTLVEDGRITRRAMESFYDNLSALACNKNFKVNIKWHARGNPLIRESLESKGFIVHDNFPLTKLYIGHFSSLLGMVPIVGGKIIVYELSGHDTPESIRQCASSIVNDMCSLEKSLSVTCQSTESKSSQAEYYFGSYYSSTTEYKTVKQYIDG